MDKDKVIKYLIYAGLGFLGAYISVALISIFTGEWYLIWNITWMWDGFGLVLIPGGIVGGIIGGIRTNKKVGAVIGSFILPFLILIFILALPF